MTLSAHPMNESWIVVIFMVLLSFVVAAFLAWCWHNYPASLQDIGICAAVGFLFRQRIQFAVNGPRFSHKGGMAFLAIALWSLALRPVSGSGMTIPAFGTDVWFHVASIHRNICGT
jgi:hypothetical protein